MPEEVFETPQTVEPTAETKPTNWPKMILVAVLGFGLLVGAAYAGYWYGTESAKFRTQSAKLPSETQTTETLAPKPTPTPAVKDKTADWKTYQSSKMGFSIKCPPDLKVFLDIPVLDEPSRADLLGSTFSTEGEVESEKGIKEKLMFIEIESWRGFTPAIGREGFSFQDWIDGEIAFFKSRWDPQLKRESFILDSTPAVKISYTKFFVLLDPPYKQVVAMIYAQRGERMYEITSLIDSENQDTYLPIFNQMISTFKFLD